MNNSEQAKNGFKTIVITLSVSSVLFSILYYVITDNGSKETVEADFDSTASIEGAAGTTVPYTYKTADTLGVSTTVATSDPSSVFADINSQKPKVNSRVVLAGATESTQSSVPETGFSSITYALILSSILLSIGAFIYMYGPRRLAISSFEKEVIQSLDQD